MTVFELANATKEVTSISVTDNETDNGAFTEVEFDPHNQLHRATIGKAIVKEFSVYPVWEYPDDEVGDYILNMQIVVEV